MFLADRLGIWLPEKRDLWRPTPRSPIRVVNGRVWNWRREEWEEVRDARYDEIVAMLGVTHLSGGAFGSTFQAVTYTGTGLQSGVLTAIPTGATALVAKGTGAGGDGDHRGAASRGNGGGGGGGAYFQTASLTVTSADYGKTISCSSDVGAPVVPSTVANGPRSAETKITSTGTSFGNLNITAQSGGIANGTSGGSGGTASNTSTGAAATGATLTSGSAGAVSPNDNTGGNGGLAAGPFAGAAGVGGVGTHVSGTSASNYGSGGGGPTDGTVSSPTSAGGGGDGRTDLVFT